MKKKKHERTKKKLKEQNIQSVGTSWNISFSAALFLPVSRVSNRTRPTAFGAMADFVWWWCWWCAFVEVGEASDTKADYFCFVFWFYFGFFVNVMVVVVVVYLLLFHFFYYFSFLREKVSPSMIIPYVWQCKFCMSVRSA